MEIAQRLDAALDEAVFTFTEVCRMRSYAPEPLLFADLSRLPGIYKGTEGLGWAFRLQDTGKWMAVTEDGTLYWASRTWRLQDQPSWLKHVVGDYFLIAQAEVQTDQSRTLCHDIMNSLLRSLELKEDSDVVQPHAE